MSAFRRSLLVPIAAVLTVALTSVGIAGAGGEPATPEPGGGLTMAVIEVDSMAGVAALRSMGLDIAAVREAGEHPGPRGVPQTAYRVEAVISQAEGATLSSEGFSWQEVPGRGPTNKIGSPYDVYHSFDEPVTGIRAELRRIASSAPKLTAIESIGTTLQGRQIPAIRITNERVKGDKPEVLFVATTHAREWVSTEVAMRLIDHLVTQFGSDARVTDLLDTTEVWIVPVVNPDGYQYTFTNERLWRKNLRDNDGDGAITPADGVDINRNFSSHWGYDNEGSSPSAASGTYRGSAPESEPETRALVDFIEAHDFEFALSYHTYGNLILYPWGWQVKTPSLDDPIFVAQAGTDANPAIYDSLLGQGYDPGVGADLYITNGEFADWAYDDLGIPAYTVELTDTYGFEFPDDEDMVQTVFDDNLEFALSMAESAVDPANPVSPVGLPAQDLYHTPVSDSYGTTQQIEVLARRGLDLSVEYSIDGGSWQTATFTERFGTFYNQEPGTYYTRYVAEIPGQQTGDTVTYQVVGDAAAGPYTYGVTSATGNPILVLAAEDYTGANPPYADTTQPNYLQYYTDALDAGGYAYDVWDVDVQGIPDQVEVLSHYDTVLWYTGDDYAARVPLGLATQEAEVLEIRDFLNMDDGRLMATGQDLSWLASAAGYYSDDFFQYYLGAYLDIDTGGIDENGMPVPVAGRDGDPIFDGLSFELAGGTGANNQCCASSFVQTASILPNFGDEIAASYDRVGGPTNPHGGENAVFSFNADSAYKRLATTVEVPTTDPTLRFYTSFDIETDWDFGFVEVASSGTDDWTTLPDAGLTTTDTGQSCLSGWVDQIHPFLAHYMDADCNPTGTTGNWNGLTGNSSGWQLVEMDLGDYAGTTVDLAISYATDWATQGLGMLVDDVQIGDGPVEGFENGLGAWTPSVAPGSFAPNNWAIVGAGEFPEGPALRTPYSLYLGFGVEAIADDASRAALIDRAMTYLTP